MPRTLRIEREGALYHGKRPAGDLLFMSHAAV
jgi:hypothetical protein